MFGAIVVFAIIEVYLFSYPLPFLTHIVDVYSPLANVVEALQSPGHLSFVPNQNELSLRQFACQIVTRAVQFSDQLKWFEGLFEFSTSSTFSGVSS
jgi:hypothetical protein